MNEILTQLKNRKSVRIFEDRAIDCEIKEKILHAAFEAPTAGGMMLYSILDITDQTLKEKLALTCDNQPFIAKAPLVLVFLADYQRWYDAYCYAECNPRQPGEGDILLACADALIAAQNTAVAAESLGVGSCYIGDIIENYEIVRELLELPDYVLPAAMLVYGYPTESQKNRKKPARFDEQFLVFENKYRRLSLEEHEEMHRTRNEKSGLSKENIYESIKANCNRKYMSEFALEMNRSAAEYLKNFRPE
ncbi:MULTISPECIES: nitroreductase family protein [Desulfitobacterium]|uniref:Nitroreductase n=1 Tax=Desulfitobacterium dehalogenans (strain ATCC 51507 / DSM 9161 / JW/IU-DC1) TaxID=756499 RepID=I4A907_DESDJ|nr:MULTISPECIES: nitroreductase family protein [Desulfitobacterium]AFM00442.1 nitroreductase [Desulfitobacterium dehalogenans ATCC 51507]